MTTKRLIPLGLTLALGALPIVGFAQTQTHLLEKGIFTEDTLGDLDGAIQIYRQVLAAHWVPRSIEAQAQLRLTESLRKKGLAPQASPAAAQQQQTPDPNACCGMFSGNYDVNRPISLVGTITGVQWVNPQSVVYIDAVDGNKWAFTIASPNQMVRGGLNKNSFKLGEQVRVSGYLANGVGDKCPTALPNACQTLAYPAFSDQGKAAPAGALHASARSITTPDGRNLFDRQAMEKAAAAAGQQ
ncbi:MAG TPA: DUF6152 family protein [Vicinamibacterales bacterium]|nr:DUF6152 family protein [Vicinamibacterales bacterium]